MKALIKRMLLLAACLVSGAASAAGALAVGRDIPADDITEFVHTRENINYGAYFLRYRYYAEEGKHFFQHQKRERKDYGPCTEADTVRAGTVLLSDSEWSSFVSLIEQGSVQKRRESTTTGDSGPWSYLYWKNDRGVIQEYKFADYGALKSFEEFSEKLIESYQGSSDQ